MHKNRFTVDVDNPELSSEENAIAAHSKIANFYKFRPPYHGDFFQQLVHKLRIDSTAEILDLCCGRGELASGISDFVNNVYGVDGSAEMLSNSINKSNVVYHQADVNKDPLPFEDKFDHFLIGSAIHWIKYVPLNNIIQKHLRKNGKVIVTHTLFRFDAEKFHGPLRKLNQKFGRGYRSVDFWGREKFEKCGFHPSDRLQLVKDVAFDIKFLYANQLSYAYRDFYKKVVLQPDAYRNEFYATITPHAVNGKLRAKLVNWAEIYTSN
jgi:SAM-dependent methyltransferase